MTDESPADETFITIKEAGTRVGVCRRTIYAWLKDGRLRYRRTAGGAVRIEAASLWRPADRPRK